MTPLDDRPAVVRMITRLNIGGPARQALSLTSRLRDEYRTMLVAGIPSPSEGELTQPDVEVVRLPLVRPLEPRSDVRALVRAAQLLHRERPRILHTHMAKAGSLGRVAARTMRHPPRTVHTFHGHVLEGYFRPAVERAFVTVERGLAHVTDALIAISPEIRDGLLDLGIGRPEQYRVIPLGFDLSEHNQVHGPSGALRARLQLAASVPLVGIVGRLVPIKDHALVLRAMVRLPDAHLAVLGDGELRGELEAQVEQLGLSPRVHFVGWWTDIPAAMADLDVVVLSSRNEGTPGVLIEAGACARPVVSTDVGGVRSVVDDEVTGLLVPRDDAEAMAAALERVLADRELASRLGHAGREHVAHFSLDRLVTDIKALYGELLDQ